MRRAILPNGVKHISKGVDGQRRQGIDIFLNIDAQDAQDKQDERLLHQKPAPAVIRCGLADAQDYKLVIS